MKVVIDTNVLIDGEYDDNSYANKIINEILEGGIQAYANKKTLQENSLILHRLIKNQEYLQKVEEMLGKVQRVVPKWIEDTPEDREDTKILASAVSADADYLITSDNGLLKIEEYQGVKIVDPATFWNKYRQEVLGDDDWGKFVRDFLSNDTNQ